MIASISKIAAVLGLAASVSAMPVDIREVPGTTPWRWDMLIPSNVTDLGTLAPKPIFDESALTARSFACTSVVGGLSATDCSYMSQIGMAGQGYNSFSNNGYIWIGTGGANTFTFYNKANPAVGIILILWDQTDYQSSFMNVRRPQVSYSIPYGGSVTVSVANGVSGAWTALYDHKTILSQYGQMWNTWAEFTTGANACVDITREVHMAGNNMNAQVSTGCLADLTHCAYVCKSGDTCGTSGSYSLIGCTGTNTGVGTYNGNPAGGCYGWSNGGHIDASFF